MLSIGSGNMQGGGAAPAQFTYVNIPNIVDWVQCTESSGRPYGSAAHSSLTDQWHPANVSVYADDISRTCTADPPTHTHTHISLQEREENWGCGVRSYSAIYDGRTTPIQHIMVYHICGQMITTNAAYHSYWYCLAELQTQVGGHITWCMD